jgi:hypothetical protein
MSKAITSGFTPGFLNQLTNIRHSFMLSLAGCALLGDDEALSLLETKSVEADQYGMHGKDIVSLVRESRDSGSFSLLMREYILFLCRGLFIQLYEAFKGDKNRFNEVKGEDWFVFMGSVRHALAHGIDAFWGKIDDYGTGQVSYTRKCDGKTMVLDKSLRGQQMRLEHIGGLDTVFDLMECVQRESENRLS